MGSMLLPPTLIPRSKAIQVGIERSCLMATLRAGTSATSKVYLRSQPEQVAPTIRSTVAGLNGPGVQRLLPIEVELDVLVQVPVEAEINRVDFVGPQVSVGKS